MIAQVSTKAVNEVALLCYQHIQRKASFLGMPTLSPSLGLLLLFQTRNVKTLDHYSYRPAKIRERERAFQRYHSKEVCLTQEAEPQS